MDRGHQYVVFGKEYEKACVGSVNALRRYSDLPVHVVTNIPKNQLSAEWKRIKDVTIQSLGLSNSHNRHVKTLMINYTPFQETLYTDCDTAILSDKFMEAFEVLEVCDLAFPIHSLKESQDRLKTKVYQQALQMFKPEGNVMVLQGGVCVYKKNERAQKFFELWNSYWECTRFRDMPGLACAAHNVTGVSIGMLPSTMGFDTSEVIQHYYGWKPPKSSHIPQFMKDAANEGKMRWEPRKCFR